MNTHSSAESDPSATALGPGIMLIKPRHITDLEKLVLLAKKWETEAVNFGQTDDPAHVSTAAAYAGTPPTGTPKESVKHRVSRESNRLRVATHRYHTLVLLFEDANGRMQELSNKVLSLVHAGIGKQDVLVATADYKYAPRKQDADNAKTMVGRAGADIEKAEKENNYVSTASFR